jgi:uncharacterized protein with von Willebrand factor type A (vWA) domain
VFIDFFYLLRHNGLNVSFNEWMVLMEALGKGLAQNSLLGFYYLCRAVLIKTEADFDKFDQVFLEYFESVQNFDEIPQEFFDWLKEPKEMKPFDKEEVDARTTFDLEKLRQMLEERLEQQHGRHDGGQFWVGTGGTSVLGHSGYASTGILVGAEGGNKHALQVAGEREFRDFREDNTLDLRSFQMAFRHLRQYTEQQDAPKDQLDLDGTISETCKNAGFLKLQFERPRANGVKVLLLFDSGGSMRPYSRICSQLFQAVDQANHFKDLKIYYFHNCVYEELYHVPSCVYDQAIQTQWVLNNLDREYKVIFVGDASMSPSELYNTGGSISYGQYNEETGLSWLLRLKNRFDKLVWFNPIPREAWEYDYGADTIEAIGRIFPMYHLSAEEMSRGLKYLISAR